MAADNFLVFTGAATGGLLLGKATQPEGETTDDEMAKVKAVELASFSFEITQADTGGSGTTGSSAGRAKFGEMTIEKDVDQATAPLFNACAAGAHFPTLLVVSRKSGGSHLKHLQYMFSQVFVTGINWSGAGGEENPKETVKFRFGAMGVQYIQQKPDGTQGTKLSASWCVIDNTNTMGPNAAPSYMPDTSS
jgi:type VI secretion system secreted protein Hcp